MTSASDLTAGERIWEEIVTAMPLQNATFAGQLRECRVKRFEPGTLLELVTPSADVKFCIRHVYPRMVSEARDQVAPGVRLIVTVKA